MRVIAVYDDTGKKSEVIADIIGDKGYADVVVKKRRLEEYYRESLKAAFPELVFKKLHLNYEYQQLLSELDMYASDDFRVIHCFSNYLITDEKTAVLSFKKLEFIDESYCVCENGKAVAAMFPSVKDYLSFCRQIISGKKAWDAARQLENYFDIEGVVDIGNTENFIQCITGHFDSRYFNKLEGNEYTLVKQSTNKQKIKAEYTFYHLLPEDMKYWFVMPFSYQEDNATASYTMERLHMTDLAIKWVHGSMDEAEFTELIKRYFYFFASRHTKECSKAEYDALADKLYEQKVAKRIEELKGCEDYRTIEQLLKAHNGPDIDELQTKYLTLKKKVEKRRVQKNELCIGHGDPCFANALYSKSTKTLKFIDPKGALNEEELWTDPYYDIAKLSHSVCGKYDFFNNAMYEIRIAEDLSYSLDIPFDNEKYKAIFRQIAEDNGYDYLLVRIYETSLFLSMLPLHIDNPHKVLGFILNAADILMEIERYV